MFKKLLVVALIVFCVSMTGCRGKKNVSTVTEDIREDTFVLFSVERIESSKYVIRAFDDNDLLRTFIVEWVVVDEVDNSVLLDRESVVIFKEPVKSGEIKQIALLKVNKRVASDFFNFDAILNLQKIDSFPKGNLVDTYANTEKMKIHQTKYSALGYDPDKNCKNLIWYYKLDKVNLDAHSGYTIILDDKRESGYYLQRIIFLPQYENDEYIKVMLSIGIVD